MFGESYNTHGLMRLSHVAVASSKTGFFKPEVLIKNSVFTFYYFFDFLISKLVYK